MKRQGYCARGVLLSVCLAALLGGVMQGHGLASALQGIGDPTRPPPGVVLKRNAAGEVIPTGPAGSASAASAPVDQPKPVALTLQAIRYEPSTKYAAAVINDEMVEVGDKVAGMTVMSISRSEAVLKGPAGLRKLTLRFEIEDEKTSTPDAREGAAAERGRKESK